MGEFSSKCIVICSEHFLPECFHQMLPVFGSTRTLKAGSCPTIWKNISKRISSGTVILTLQLSELINWPNDLYHL